MRASESERLAALLEGARDSGLTIDFLYDLTEGLSLQALRKVIGNASSIPSYRKSSESPYVLRRESAPFKERRCKPASH